MKNWIKKNFTLTILLAILSSVIGYASSQAVTRSDVDRLNTVVFGKNSYGDDLSSRMGRLEQKSDDQGRNISDIKQSVYRIEGMIAQ